jgi:hypothetical protein
MAINPWLEEQLATKGGSIVPVILEVPQSKKGYATNLIRSYGGKLSSVSNIAGMSFISMRIDSSQIDKLSEIGTVHYNMPKGISLSMVPMNHTPSLTDKMLGKVYLSNVEVPTTPNRMLSDSAKIMSEDIIKLPSGDTVAAVKNTALSTTLIGRGVKMGVIDTGFVYGLTHPMIGMRYPELYTTMPEPPIDGQAHGSWCTFMAGGNEFNHPTLGKMAGVAPGSNIVHIKALSTLGFGSSESVLKAMEIAYNTGCKVVSMSLGGPSQGGVDDDPESKAIELLTKKGMIMVVAAGNDGADWTIGSPAMSPYAVTVGSWGYTDNALSSFSSRGPQCDWYSNNPEAFERDLLLNQMLYVLAVKYLQKKRS